MPLKEIFFSFTISQIHVLLQDVDENLCEIRCFRCVFKVYSSAERSMIHKLGIQNKKKRKKLCTACFLKSLTP